MFLRLVLSAFSATNKNSAEEYALTCSSCLMSCSAMEEIPNSEENLIFCVLVVSRLYEDNQ